MVLVGDEYNPDRIIGVLRAAGVKSEHIHISRDIKVEESGVHRTLKPGQLRLGGTDSKTRMDP